MKKHINIPIFIPHLGCPNQCVFCNQRSISGVREFDENSVYSIIDTALSTVGIDTEAEIAFFGGSFTGIDRCLMIRLLDAAYEYVKAGRVKGIRCSTRPDYIDAEVLEILKRYSVNVIELGLQSSSDEVLTLSKRGHGRAAEERACRMIVDFGFELVGQMMIGLPGSTAESEEETADFIIASGASAARIYPTVVFRDTELCHMTESGVYTPLTLDEAVNRTANVLIKLRGAGIEVIRVGLCATENLESDKTYFAGPNHPALGELVENEVYYRLIKNEISKIPDTAGKELTVFVAKGEMSKAVGQKRKNKIRLVKEFGLYDVRFLEDGTLYPNTVRVLRKERKDKCT